MPSRTALVDEALRRLETAGLRSKLLELDSATLRDLAIRLTDMKLTVADAYRWLNESLGGDDTSGGQVVDDNAVYRFAANFRQLYRQVQSEHARRLVRLSIDQATHGNVTAQAQVAQARLIELVAEKLVETDNLEDLSSKDLAGVIATVDAWTKGQIKAAELELKREQAEHRAAKLEADIERMQREQARKDRQIEERVKSLQTRLNDLVKRSEKGQSIDPSVFARIRDELAGLTTESTEGTEK